MSISQRDAVIAAVESIGHECAKNDEVVSLTKEEHAEVLEICTQNYLDGSTKMKDSPANTEKLNDPAKMRSYARGQINDAFRKDKRLNGDVTYIGDPAKKGTRAASGDSKLKELKKLRTAYQAANEPEKVQLIENAINARTAEVQAEKAKNTKVDLSKIDPELLAQLGMDAS